MGYFTRSLSVIHPEGDLKELSKSRRYKYALGVGALMSKHCRFFGPKIVARKIFVPIFAALKNLANGRFVQAKLSMIDLFGRIYGYSSARTDTPCLVVGSKRRR